MRSCGRGVGRDGEGTVGSWGGTRRGARDESVEEGVEDVEEVVSVGSSVVEHLEREGSDSPVGDLVAFVRGEVAVEGEKGGEGVGGEF